MNNEAEPTAQWTIVFTAIGTLLASVAKVAVLLDIVDWDTDQLAGISLVIDNALAVMSGLLIILFVRPRVTPVDAPNLPIGTIVNENNPAPTGRVEALNP